MAILKGKGRQSTAIARESEGAEVFLRALRDGSAILSNWKEAAVMGGFGYTATLGAFSTPVVGGGAGSTIDLDEPELIVKIPNGTSLLPLRVDATVQQGTLADREEYEILVAVDQDNTGGTTTAGANTALDIHNLNTLCGKTSACTVESLHTGTMDPDPALDIELAHAVMIADGDGTEVSFEWKSLHLVYEPKNPPIINGPALLLLYYGGDTACNGFASVSWLEFPETAFKV